MIILFSGDFRQILSVILRRARADEGNATIKIFYIRLDITDLKYTTNIRILLSEKSNGIFADGLLHVGDCQSPTINGNTGLTDTCFLVLFEGQLKMLPGTI